MKKSKYVILDRDGKEVARGKTNQKDRRVYLKKGNTAQLLEDYAKQAKKVVNEAA